MSGRPPLEPEQLFEACDPDTLDFETTAALKPHEGVIGQQRAVEAIHFGTRISGDGYNVFALGVSGTGRHTAVRRILEKESRGRPVPDDWCYVNNFHEPHRPKALRLLPGRAARLREDMDRLIDDLGTTIPSAFETEEYRSRVEKLELDLAERRNDVLNELAEEARNQRVQLLHTPTGFAFAPMNEKSEVIEPDAYQKLPAEERKRLEQTVEKLQKKLQRVVRQFPLWQKETREKLRELDREIARYAVGHLIDSLQEQYADVPEVVQYLEEVEGDTVDNVKAFRTEQQPAMPFDGGLSQEAVLQRFRINVLVENSAEGCAPVVYQDLPNHPNLVGRIEHRAQMGTLLTDFTLIKSGDLHRANGGYLILDARRVLTQPFAWETLKRALRAREIRIESPERIYGLLSTVSLEPEPIPLEVKVVLIGDRRLYYLLCQLDPEFSELFKVSADFEDSIDRNPEGQQEYLGMLARVIDDYRLAPFDRGAVARVIERSARLSGEACKLSVHARSIAELLRESDYWARQAGRERVEREDVQRAIDARIRRADRVRERMYEAIEKGIVRIDTEGGQVGQINGLSVLDLGDFVFGQPSRITATTRLGDGKVIDIERETELGGKIHAKGVLILSSFLASRYAPRHPLSFSASLVFEQSYGQVEGDSASLAELCALLSALSNLPVAQCFAVTGSVNQHGQVQAIGGVNQKVEGFFDVCRAFGLSGDQGVLIPRTNVRHLMLREDLVDAARRREFRVHAVDTVDEALAILLNTEAGDRDAAGKFPADSVNGRVESRLIELADLRQRFGKEQGGGGQSEVLNEEKSEPSP